MFRRARSMTDWPPCTNGTRSNRTARRGSPRPGTASSEQTSARALRLWSARSRVLRPHLHSALSNSSGTPLVCPHCRIRASDSLPTYRASKYGCTNFSLPRASVQLDGVVSALDVQDIFQALRVSSTCVIAVKTRRVHAAYAGWGVGTEDAPRAASPPHTGRAGG